MSKFPTQYDKFSPVVSSPGSNIESVYSSDDSGKPFKSGVKDLDAEIQAYCDSTELSTLLMRYEGGDITALNRSRGVYADVSNTPSTYFESVEQVKRAEDDFYKLPEQFRKLFGDSPAEFYSDFGSDKFNEKVTKYRNSRVSTKKSDSSSSSDPSL